MQNTDKKKDFLKSLEDKKVSNVVFKPEGLGALEFDIVMTGKNFETTSIPFRVERIFSLGYIFPQLKRLNFFKDFISKRNSQLEIYLHVVISTS